MQTQTKTPAQGGIRGRLKGYKADRPGRPMPGVYHRRPAYARQTAAHIAAGHPVTEIWIFHGPGAFDRASRRPGGLALPPDTDPGALDWGITAGRAVLICPAPRQRFRPGGRERLRRLVRSGDAWQVQPAALRCTVAMLDTVDTPADTLRRLALACLRAGAVVVRSLDHQGVTVYGG